MPMVSLPSKSALTFASTTSTRPLVYHSEYFRKAVQGSWKEAQEGVMRIDDVQPSECTYLGRTACPKSYSRELLLTSFVVSVFAHWLYIQKVPGIQAHDTWDRILENKDHNLSVNMHLNIKAYALGDRLLASYFRRAINDATTGITHEGNCFLGSMSAEACG
ncbi:hypothetical protein BU25DRAFT_423167 [Macroventuria anomochaeta]|uniref:Uncharacterized protein n=1 Tax=Macroventuria anomochaeta TaxID=301207 RepID=A0ACB6RWD1_9PLEO|nr:uncharacterized protein BU25DRAFT_423167 [Macroventuria anomochaeta]KAF2625448.1 hypothetical protein BU25DRAFT_423167 [Macroventuria anomochaeta]